MARARVTITLGRRADGVVRIELRTSPPLVEHEDWDGSVFRPGEDLQRPDRVGFHSVGDPPRFVKVRASAWSQGLGGRWLDLSQGSEERALVELMASQERIPVLWVNEKVEASFSPVDEFRRHARDALEQARGVSSQDYREEIAELEWRSSDSYRPGRPRPKKYQPRSITPPPEVSLPFFARRSGAVPNEERPEVDGVGLPAGHPRPDGSPAYWISDQPVPNIAMVAPFLASRFSDTGLWPLLWPSDAEPDDYAHPDNVEGIDQVDLNAAFKEGWEWWPPREEGAPEVFPGMADPVPGEQLKNPFPDWTLAEPSRLLLIPCNRPADAITVIGGIFGETPQEVISAILRSWEERFGAVIIAAFPGLTRVSVARHPTNDEQAQKLAAEIYACNNSDAELKLKPLIDLAHDLQHAEHKPGTHPADQPITTSTWDILW